MLNNQQSKLDNLYVQIKIHHERGDYEKAAVLLREASSINETIGQIKNERRQYA